MKYRDMTLEQQEAYAAEQEAKRNTFTDRLHSDDKDAARVAGITVAQLQEAERQGKGPWTRWTADLKRFGIGYRPVVPGAWRG